MNSHLLWQPLAGSLLLCQLLMTSVGCAPRLKQTQAHDAGPLIELSNAYRQATEKLNRAPTSAEELQPYLAQGKDVTSLLTSPADGEPYVILWGTDPREGMDLKPLVIGYEKKGLGGTRFVFTAMGVSLMAEKDFQSAKFPAGHKP